MSGRIRLVLASGSPRRLQLLAQIGVVPDRVLPLAIDESPRRKETPRNLAARLAREKAEAALAILKAEADTAPTLILAADTVVAVGRRCLPKAELIEEAAACLRQLSGRAHRVHSALTLVTARGALRHRLVETRVRFKRLSREDLDAYIASGEWRGKAGGYAVQGLAGSFVIKLVGSYSGVVGLPLYETMNLLAGETYPVHFGWLNPA